jgi:hypothetical protein
MWWVLVLLVSQPVRVETYSSRDICEVAGREARAQYRKTGWAGTINFLCVPSEDAARSMAAQPEAKP